MKTVEEYLAGLTGKQMRAALLKFWAEAGGRKNGAENLERWRAGQSRIRFEEIECREPTSPLVGTVVETLRLNPYQVASIADAIKLRQHDGETAKILRQFSGDAGGLAEAANVDLVQFNRWPFLKEMVAWGKANTKKPIVVNHLLGISLQHPEVAQRNSNIIALGSVRHGRVLCLNGTFGWSVPRCDSVVGGWGRYYLFGFVSELP